MKRHHLSVPILMLAALLLLSGCQSYPAPPAPESIVTSPPPKVPAPDTALAPGVTVRPEIDYDALAAERVAALPQKNMQQAVFLIATTNAAMLRPELKSEEEGGRTIDLAVRKRNQLIEKTYNIQLLTVEYSTEGLVEQVRGAVHAGIYLADLIELPHHRVGALADTTLPVNMNALPFTDYTAEYFDGDAIDQCSAGYYTYAVAGNANRYEEKALCLFFNADLLSAKAEELYGMVYDGTLTWDAVFPYLEKAEGDAIALPEGTDVAQLVLAAGRLNLLRTAYGVLPEAEEDKSAIEAAVSITARLLPLIGEERGTEGFLAGEIPFCVAEAETVRRLGTASFSWGVLPLPKHNAEQQGYGTLGSYQTVFTAISTVTALDRTGMILQALNAASVGQNADALAREALAEYLQSVDGARMLQIATEHRHYDLGYMLKQEFGSIRNASVQAFADAVAGLGSFAERYALVEGELLRLNEKNFVWD